MKNNVMLRIALFAVGLFSLANLQAQEATDDSADVWSAVEAQWAADENGDKKWVDRLLTDDFVGWSKNSPAPRNKSSTKMWDRFDEQWR